MKSRSISRKIALGMIHEKGGGGSTTTKPSKQQEAILQKQLGIANNLERQGQLRFFPGQTLADQSDFTRLGQRAALGQANNLRGFGALQQRTLQGLLDPTSEASRATTAPLIRQLQEQIIPQIGTNAVNAGAFGGDRQFIQQRQAAGETTDRVTQAILRNQGEALRLAPQVAQQQLLPAQILGDVGQQQQDRQQDVIDAQRERFEFQEFGPTDLANRVNSILGGLNFGNVTKTSSGGK